MKIYLIIFFFLFNFELCFAQQGENTNALTNSTNNTTQIHKYPADLRDILEMIYFISAPMILILVIIGLYQLKLTKNIARISSMRESYRIAAEQVSFYCNQLIPYQNVLDAKVATAKITFFKDAKVIVSGKTVKVNFKKDPEIKKYDTEFLNCFNGMEGFAIYFTKKIAHENSAFNSIGNTYCNEVKGYLPLLILLNKSGAFNNVLELFFLWNQRIEKNNLLKEKNNLDQKIEELDGKFINPIGL